MYKGEGKQARLILTCGILVYSISAAFLWFNRKIETRNKRKLIKNRAINIGAIFGMDVGGTLAKLIYFEKDVGGKSPSAESTAESMKRSASFVRLDKPDHREALEDLYSMISAEGNGLLRDNELSIHSPVLGGRLHFLHFETRNMVTAINLLSENSVTANIHTIGCTGGGAHKYEKEFSEQLGIRVESQDELAALIKGMLFAIATVKGECFTYRPPRGGPSACGNTAAEPEAEAEDTSHGGSGAAVCDEETDSWPPSTGSGSSPPKAQAARGPKGGRARVYSDGIISTPLSKQSITDKPPVGPAPSASPNSRTGPDSSSPLRDGVAAALRGRSRTGSFAGGLAPNLSSGSLQADGTGGSGGSAGSGGTDSHPARRGSAPALTALPKAAPAYAARAAYTEKVELDASVSSSSFPYLIVNIGSGVSILKVTSPTTFERVSGSSVGGGTYWGLTRLFTGASSYAEALSMSEDGDATQVDMLVSDIYGGGCELVSCFAALLV
jgi:pantothenate kinase